MSEKLKEKVRAHVEMAWRQVTRRTAHKSIGVIYKRLRPKGKGSRNWNGMLLEQLISRYLETKIGKKCIFRNKKLALIDDTKYDILLCSTDPEHGTQSPICISIKTSLRERYKQAEREGLTAKQVHLGSFTALLTMDREMVEKKGERMRGLDMVIDCNNSRQLRHFLNKVISLNPTPIGQIREIGPLISDI